MERGHSGIAVLPGLVIGGLQPFDIRRAAVTRCRPWSAPELHNTTLYYASNTLFKVTPDCASCVAKIARGKRVTLSTLTEVLYPC